MAIICFIVSPDKNFIHIKHSSITLFHIPIFHSFARTIVWIGLIILIRNLFFLLYVVYH